MPSQGALPVVSPQLNRSTAQGTLSSALQSPMGARPGLGTFVTKVRLCHPCPWASVSPSVRWLWVLIRKLLEIPERTVIVQLHKGYYVTEV